MQIVLLKLAQLVCYNFCELYRFPWCFGLIVMLLKGVVWRIEEAYPGKEVGSGFSEFIPGGPVDLTVTHTYFKEPKLGVIGLGSCYYEKTACTGGTVPTCAGGVGVAAYLPPCPPYSISFFLVARSASLNACTVAFSLEALGPGPCT